MKIEVQSKGELIRSTLNDEILCSLSDIISDIESRITSCIAYLERNHSTLSKYHVQCISSFLINQFAQNEKGVYLSKISLQRVVCVPAGGRPLSWINAQKIIMYYGDSINFCCASLDHLSFSECCLYSLSKVYESTLRDLNHFLRRVLCYCLSLISRNWFNYLGEDWITNLFNHAKNIALNVCERYASCGGMNSSFFTLYSLSPFAVAGASLGIALKSVAEGIYEEGNTSKTGISEVLYRAYVDCLTYFCNCNFTEEKRFSLFLCCLNFPKRAPKVFYTDSSDVNNKEVRFKLRVEPVGHCCFFSSILLSNAEMNTIPSEQISFRNSYNTCFTNPIFLQNFLNSVSRKRDYLCEDAEVLTPTTWENIMNETDQGLRSTNFNDNCYIAQKIKFLNDLGGHSL